jgi:hypothetical protein
VNVRTEGGWDLYYRIIAVKKILKIRSSLKK